VEVFGLLSTLSRLPVTVEAPLNLVYEAVHPEESLDLTSSLSAAALPKPTVPTFSESVCF